MYISIDTTSQFAEAFVGMGRGDQFSYEALEALFEHYNELSDYELDVIEICCDWTEYGSQDEACEELGMEDLDELNDNHSIIELSNGGVLVSN